MNIYKSVKNSIICSIAITLILILISSIFLWLNNDSNPIKNGFTLIGNYFSGITTLTAAYIASLLFNDWRNPHKATFYTNECKSIINCYKDLLSSKRKLSILEQQVMEIIYSDNGLNKLNPNILSPEKKIKLNTFNNEIKKETEYLFEQLTKISSETIMISTLTEDNNFLIEIINLDISLTKSFQKILDDLPENMPYERFNILKEANKNNYLSDKGKELIRKIKTLGNV